MATKLKLTICLIVQCYTTTCCDIYLISMNLLLSQLEFTQHIVKQMQQSMGLQEKEKGKGEKQKAVTRKVLPKF